MSSTSWFKRVAQNYPEDFPGELFHGTTHGDEIRNNGFKKGWIYLTDSKEIADSYQAWVRGNSPATLHVSFRPKNPAYFDAKGLKYSDHKANLSYHIYGAALKAEKAGHDALVVKSIRDHYDSSVPTSPHTTVIVFNPEEIKLIDDPQNNAASPQPSDESNSPL